MSFLGLLVALVPAVLGLVLGYRVRNHAPWPGREPERPPVKPLPKPVIAMPNPVIRMEAQEHECLEPRSVEEWGHSSSCRRCRDRRFCKACGARLELGWRPAEGADGLFGAMVCPAEVNHKS